MNDASQNGILELTSEQKAISISILQNIINNFQASEETPTITTHFLAGEHNYLNPNSLLNGDTVDFLLIQVSE